MLFEEETEIDFQQEATDDNLLTSPKDWKEKNYSEEQQLKAPRGIIFETRIEASRVLRQIGNDRVSNGNIDDALGAYRRALWHVDFDEGYVQLEMLPEHQHTVYEAQTPIRLNLAQCLLKQAGSVPVSEAARQLDLVLEAVEKYQLDGKWQTKALYWRAKARLAAGVYDQAESDLVKAVTHDPNDKLIRSALADVRHQRRQLRQDQRSLYQGKLVQSSNENDDNRWRCLLS